MIELPAILKLLLLLGVANGTPILAKRIFGKRLATPVDGGLHLPDGRPLFGASKTLRGIVLSVVVTALLAPLLGFDWVIGAGFAAASMLGDLLSSFIKRRLGLAVHGQALGLDQIPESLLPLLLLQRPLGIGGGDIVLVVVVFFVLELVLSWLLFKLHVRDRPY